jgi:exosome complex component RRP4
VIRELAKEGRIIDVTPSKVPRLIGRSGSMIAMLKNETNCNIFVGQNGRIWLTGKDKGMDMAVKAIFKIERESHIPGLTDRMIMFFKDEKHKPIKKPEKEIVETEEVKIEEPAEEVLEEEKSGGILDELLGDNK